MTRISKQEERRHVSKRRPRPPSIKTGPKKDALPNGFVSHENAIPTDGPTNRFFPKKF